MTDRKVHKQHHWKWGHDPNDPDAVKGSPWLYATLDPQSPPSPPPEPVVRGPDSGVTCFRCHNNTYRIIDSRPVDIITGYSIKHEEFHDTDLALACPNCNDRVEMLKSVVDRIRLQQEKH